MGVQELKHAARLREWSMQIAECRSSGMTVKSWCEAQGISVKTYYNRERQCISEAGWQNMLTETAPAGVLMRVDPQSMPDNSVPDVETGVTIRHGNSIITLPAGYTAASIADLVKALNRHV